MSRRTLTKEEKQINKLKRNLPKMVKSVAFLDDVKAFTGLRRVEEIYYILYFNYGVETENQESGMTYETGDNDWTTSRNPAELQIFADRFNILSDDEKRAILIQLFPRDFKYDADEAIIGFMRSEDWDSDEGARRVPRIPESHASDDSPSSYRWRRVDLHWYALPYQCVT